MCGVKEKLALVRGGSQGIRKATAQVFLMKITRVFFCGLAIEPDFPWLDKRSGD